MGLYVVSRVAGTGLVGSFVGHEGSLKNTTKILFPMRPSEKPLKLFRAEAY